MAGIRKHRISGRVPKSPKFRHAMKREAEKHDRKRRQYEMAPSLRELFK